MRIAWIGGTGGKDGGVGSVAFQILKGLLRAGATVEVFAIGDAGTIPPDLAGRERLVTHLVRHHWSWGRWYSRNRLSALGTNLGTRVLCYRRMIHLVRRRHAEEPFDVIFQMSQTELFNLKRYLDELPPVVVFPCVHAAGELRWHRVESHYARQVENSFFHYLIRIYLIFRAKGQGRELHKPAMVIGMSHRFNELLRQDYGLHANRQAVIYNPIEPPPAGVRRVPEARDTGRPLRLLFVARISVRKGVEQIVELSKRLDDLAGKVELHVIGGATLWSDYRGHLSELNPRIAMYLGGKGHSEIMSAYDSADALLLPSHYEPGGIVVGEALSRGLPVVVNEEIGSAEPIVGTCARRFRAGDIDRFEAEVRKLLQDLWADPAPLRASAREQARLHFAPEKIARDFLTLLEGVVARSKGTTIPSQLQPV